MPSLAIQRLTYILYRLAWNGLDLIFPPQCGGCGRPGSRWCVDCQHRVAVICNPMCGVCGLPQRVAGICPACQKERPSFQILRSWSVFADPVQEALHRLKYRRDVGLGDALAAQLDGFVRGLNWRVDMVIPIPLGRKRFQERGYNQVALIARPLALALGVDYAPLAMNRQKETRSQVGLTRQERHENVREAFSAIGEQVNGKKVMLVDDVATTGSTLSAGARALLSAGAREVYSLTVARAVPRHEMVHF